MLTIRSEQLDAFEQGFVGEFVERMVQHLSEFAPTHVKALGHTATGDIVRSGIERADGYGLTTEGSARLYLEMTFLLGSNFDTDPQFPVVADILTGSRLGSRRAGMLYDWITSYVNEAFGPGGKYLRDALARTESVSPQTLDFESSGPNHELHLREILKWVYPEKYSYLGPASVSALCQRAKQAAEESLPGSPLAYGTIGALMFFLGHNVLRDPLYPWIRVALVGDSRQRAVDLLSKSKAYAKASLRSAER